MNCLGKVVIHTDGSCEKRQKRGGWAGALEGDFGREIVYGYTANTTNNRMELTAVINSLNQLPYVPCEIEIRSDSRYVVDGINNNVHVWKMNGWRTRANKPIENPDLWKTLLPHLERNRVTAVWVRGHNGDPTNELVDWFAQRARKHPPRKPTLFG